MKTKLFFLFSFILWAGQSIAQIDPVLDRVLHFEQFVNRLQYRQPNAATIRLDSVSYKYFNDTNNAYDLNSINTFIYDNNNFNIENINKTWSSNTNSLYVSGKSLHTYTSSGQIASSTFYDFDSNSNLIYPTIKNIYNYNNSGQLIEYITQTYDVNTSQFINYTKEVYTYAQSSDPKPNNIVIYQWDAVSATWIEDHRASIVYNSNFQFTNILVEVKDSSTNTWVNIRKFIRYYDSSMHLTEQIEQTWQNNTWQNDKKIAFSYLSFGNYDEVIRDSFNWDDTNNVWALVKKKKLRVDANNHILQTETFYWDTINNVLTGGRKTVYVYNTNFIELDYYDWDTQAQDWMNDFFSKEILTYNMNVTKNDLILPLSYSYNSMVNDLFNTEIRSLDIFEHQLLQVERFSRILVSDPWVPFYKETYLYTDTTAAIDNEQQIMAKVFPNPFKDYLQFELDTDDYNLNIYHLDGRLLYQKNHNVKDQINLSSLPKGVYIYKLTTAKGLSTGQIIKK